MQLIVAPQLLGGWRHNYLTKTKQAGHANEQSMYSLMSMPVTKEKSFITLTPGACTIKLITSVIYGFS